MRKALRSDMRMVVDVIAATFRDNPAVNWLVRPGRAHTQGLCRLAEYAFIKSHKRGEVFISDNEKGVALCFRSDRKPFSWSELWYRLRFAFTSIRLNRLPKVLKREAIRARIRPTTSAYYYFWFLAVLPEGRGAGFELKNAVLAQAAKENLPVYLETSIERNQKIYEHIGFKTYHYWEDQEENIRFWFLKWEPPILIT